MDMIINLNASCLFWLKRTCLRQAGISYFGSDWSSFFSCIAKLRKEKKTKSRLKIAIF